MKDGIRKHLTWDSDQKPTPVPGVTLMEVFRCNGLVKTGFDLEAFVTFAFTSVFHENLTLRFFPLIAVLVSPAGREVIPDMAVCF